MPFLNYRQTKMLIIQERILQNPRSSFYFNKNKIYIRFQLDITNKIKIYSEKLVFQKKFIQILNFKISLKSHQNASFLRLDITKVSAKKDINSISYYRARVYSSYLKIIKILILNKNVIFEVILNYFLKSKLFIRFFKQI